MSRLKDGIPRGFADHRTKVSKVYGEYVRALQAKYRPGPEGRPALREAGRITVELERLAVESEALRQKPNFHKGEMRRLRREQQRLRVQLLMLERRLEFLAGIAQETRDPLEQMFSQAEADR